MEEYNYYSKFDETAIQEEIVQIHDMLKSFMLTFLLTALLGIFGGYLVLNSWEHVLYIVPLWIGAEAYAIHHLRISDSELRRRIINAELNA